ncbi:MAG: hypothetical protein EU548_07755 [Promethearchaeota archaeon]|nr:MAG: hypothetical protein EU548_07755 [Candidatus Lokiarchaeota archaeon]
MIHIIIAIFQILIGIGIILFWIGFYFTECRGNRNMPDDEYKHELSFPLPDLGWVTPTLFIAAIGLLMGERFGYYFSAIAGSGMIFLGLIDLAADKIYGRFETKDYRMFLAISIGVVLLIFGPIFIIYGWLNI